MLVPLLVGFAILWLVLTALIGSVLIPIFLGALLLGGGRNLVRYYGNRFSRR